MTLVARTSPQAGVDIITLSRPDSLNAFTDTMLSELSDHLRAIAADRDCRVVILTGAGRGFCAGVDLRGYSDDDAGFEATASVMDWLDRQRVVASIAEQLHRLPQPVIAAVNGPAAGGGFALACASDIRIASEPAVFAVSFIRAGFSACDMGVSWLLPRIVGAGNAHELMLTGRQCDSAEALRIGLVTQVLPAADLMSAALAKASEIMFNPPFSTEMTKQGMWTALETPSLLTAIEFENRQQVLTALTKDRREAALAFLEKRQGEYQRR